VPKKPTEVSDVSWTLRDVPGTRAELLRLLFAPVAAEDEEDAPG
jgi:hypothetical protein